MVCLPYFALHHLLQSLCSNPGKEDPRVFIQSSSVGGEGEELQIVNSVISRPFCAMCPVLFSELKRDGAGDSEKWSDFPEVTQQRGGKAEGFTFNQAFGACPLIT